MAALPGSILQFVVKAAADNQEIVNVLHYKYTPQTPPRNPDVGAAEAILVLIPFWRASVLPLLHQSYVVSEYIVRELGILVQEPGEQPKPEIVDQRLIAGSAVLDHGADIDDPLPTYVAVSMKKTTALGNRNFRGGIRFGPIAEPDSDYNLLDPAVVGSWTTLATALLAGLTIGAGDPDHWDLAVYSRTLHVNTGGLASLPATYTQPVVSLSVRPTLGSQVSRKRKSGGN